MTTNETLRLLLPKAMGIGTDQVAARRFDLDTYVNQENAFQKVRITGIYYTPVITQIQIFTFVSGLNTEQIGGVDGYIPFEKLITKTEKVTYGIFNLSTETEANLVIYFTGFLYGEGR